MTTTEKKRLEIRACKVRMGIIQAARSAGSGHLPSSFPPPVC